MSTRLFVCALILGTGLIANAADPQQKRPRWMSPEAGWVDEESDTRVEKVTRDEEKGAYRVELSVPKLQKPVEEVLVIGEKDEVGLDQYITQSPPVIPVRFEVINDLDNERSGIIVYIGEKEDFAIRINYHDGSQQTLPTPRPVGGLVP